MIERNVTIPGGSNENSSPRNAENLQASRTNSPRGSGSTQLSTTRSSLSSSRVSSPIGQGNRGSSEEKPNNYNNLSASTNAINSTSSVINGRSENRVHFDLKNSDMTKSQGSLNTGRAKAGGNLSSAASTVRRLTTSQPHHLSALPLDARQRLEEMVGVMFKRAF